MPFISPAQKQIDEINEQMERWSRYDTLLALGHKLVEVARLGRRACKQKLRELEVAARDILDNPPLYTT